MKPSTELPLRGDSRSALQAEMVAVRVAGVKVLQRVSLSCEPGSITCLVGGNGSGKTTLLNAITGFCAVDSGTIHVNGTNVSHASPLRIARLGVARTFQVPFVAPNLSVVENVLAGRRHQHEQFIGFLGFCLAGNRTLDAKDQAMACLEAVGLASKHKAFAGNLSGGQRRRLEIARVAFSSAPVVLLDEPLANLDDEGVERVVALLDSLRLAGTTILLTEHRHHRFPTDYQMMVLELSNGRLGPLHTPSH